jgi:hypothetical protein
MTPEDLTALLRRFADERDELAEWLDETAKERGSPAEPSREDDDT